MGSQIFQKKKSTSYFKHSRHVNGYMEKVPSAAPTSSRRHHKSLVAWANWHPGFVYRWLKCTIEYLE